MSDQPNPPSPDQPDDQPQPDNTDNASANTPSSGGGLPGGSYRHQQLSARVPEAVSLGVFSTGAIILTTQTEFVIDFLIRMSRPHQVAARVVLPPGVVPQVIGALRQSIDRWQSHFGAVPPLPRPDRQQRPVLQEVYEELKMADTILSGAYANGVMISFSAAEFSFDFITNFFPRSAVSQRVYLSVPQVPRLLEALEQTLAEFQKRQGGQQQLPRQENPQAGEDAPDWPGYDARGEDDSSGPETRPS